MRTSSAIFRDTSSKVFKSLPKILIPTCERIPVVSMSMRLMIGCVQMFVTPGKRSFSSISASRDSRVTPLRHCSGDFRWTIVSFMLTGEGSVDVSARPAFPTADSTSGKLFRISSCLLMIFRASSTEIAGSVTGMYIRSPSFSGGINSLPMPVARKIAPEKSRRAMDTVSSR